MNVEFVSEVKEECTPDERGNVFDGIWTEYEKVLLRSLLTTFGLDFMINDQTGGDVDTVYNVREGIYKNPANQANYERRGSYDAQQYHGQNKQYRDAIRESRHKELDDAYVPDHKVYYAKASIIKRDPQKQANLDHVIPAKEIHDDPGRILAGLNGPDLANRKDNLKFTNEHLNKQKGDRSIDELVNNQNEKGEPFSPEEVANMQAVDKAARKDYEKEIREKYYSSDRFIANAAKAATKLGIQMGIRQAVGFVMVEIWAACSESILSVPDGSDWQQYFSAIQKGVENGVKSIEEKHKDLFVAFGEGVLSGIATSIATTIINIFFTTDKMLVQIIRQGSVCVFQAGNVLLFNPNDLRTGDRIKMTTVILASGASSVAGIVVRDYLEELLDKVPKVGELIASFCGTLVSALLSCTFLLILDRSKWINTLIERLNQFAPVEYTIQETSRQFSALAVELGHYDFDSFTKECEQWNDCARLICNANTEDELETALTEAYSFFSIEIPWTGDFNDFMGDGSNKLVFGGN